MKPFGPGLLFVGSFENYRFYFSSSDWSILFLLDSVFVGCMFLETCLGHDYFLKINLSTLFIYFWLHWVFIAVHRLSLVAASGGYSALRCTGFSMWWFLLLRSTGSRCAGFSSCGSQALKHRLSSCGTQA